MKRIKYLSGHECLLLGVIERCQKEIVPIEIAYELYKAKAINSAWIPLTSPTFQHYWNVVTLENKIQKRLHSISDKQKTGNEEISLSGTSYGKPVQPELNHTKMQHKQGLKSIFYT